MKLARTVLSNFTTYTAKILGGSSGVKDIAGNAMAADKVWSFTTAKPTPTFTAGANVTVLENAAPYSNTWATNITGGPVTFVVTNNNNALFSVQPDVSATGVLTFTPAQNAYGTATITATAYNDEDTGSTPATFTVTVTHVNQAPSFTADGNIVVNENSGAYSKQWATNVSAGPNESSQTVNFVVTNDNNSLFSVQPAISSTGVLTFTPATNTSGTVTVTLYRSQGSVSECGISQIALSARTSCGSRPLQCFVNAFVSIQDDE